jgi:hypothetical protein
MNLTATITVRGGVVAIAWSVENTLAEPVLLFRLLAIRYIGPPIVYHPAMVYHVVEDWRPGLLPGSDAPRLVIAKAVMPIRPGNAVYVPDVPFATQLAPGQCFDEALEQHFPRYQHNPHVPFGPQEGLDKVVCRRIAFRVGYAPLSAIEALDVRPELMHIDHAEVYRLPFVAALAAQQVVDSEAVPAELLLWLY